MSGNKVMLFIIFDLLVISSFAAESSDILYEVLPFIKVYKNGSVERLTDTVTVPPSLDPRSRVLSKDIIFEQTLNISARIFLPTTATTSATRKLPLLVYFHGGAFLAGSPFSPTYHNYLKSVVATANVVAVSVNYRLAPEHPLPIAYKDGLLALKWAFSHRENGNGTEMWLRNYADFKRVFIGGDSAGGNIAHNVAMRVGLEKPEGIIVHGMHLNCPHFWGKVRIGNETSYPKMVDSEERQWLHAYPNSTGDDDPASNPALDPNLWRLGCKKVLVYISEIDVLRDRGLLYKKALEKSKWNGVVKVVESKGESHVFNIITPNTKKSKEKLKHFALFLNGRERMREKRLK